MSAKSCQLHGIKDCPICDKHLEECDFGSCIAPYVTTVPCFNADGKHVEGRKACATHANYQPGFGVGYGSMFMPADMALAQLAEFIDRTATPTERRIAAREDEYFAYLAANGGGEG